MSGQLSATDCTWIIEQLNTIRDAAGAIVERLDELGGSPQAPASSPAEAPPPIFGPPAPLPVGSGGAPTATPTAVPWDGAATADPKPPTDAVSAAGTPPQSVIVGVPSATEPSPTVPAPTDAQEPPPLAPTPNGSTVLGGGEPGAPGAQERDTDSQWSPPTAEAFVKAAQSYAGVPYQAGGGHGGNPHPLTGLDAAGLVRMALWDASGVDPGDGDCESYRARWKSVDASAAQPGDVLYFGLHGTGSGVADHCAIALGDGACIQSPEPATSVSQGPINMFLQGTLISANRPWQ